MGQRANVPVSDGKGLLYVCERLPKSVLAVVSVVLTLLVSYTDFVTGKELSLLVFYTFPIGIAAWYGSRNLGLFVATLSGIGWVTAELLYVIQVHPLILIWNAAMRASVFLVLAYLLSMLRVRLTEVTLQARTDSLTGLANRRYLYERANAELQRAPA